MIMVATAYSIEPSPPEGGERRRTWLLIVGVVVLVVGLAAGVGLWVAAASRLDDAVTGLARAPVDCTTTLNFSQTGEFLIFIETEGVLEGVRGDCDAAGGYRYTGDTPPEVALSMQDPDGGDVDLQLDSGADYDAAGFVGQSERVVVITTTGDHVLTVGTEEGAGSADRSFAIAVGKDPNSGVAMLRIGAVIAALAGLIVGVACIVLGSRRRPAVASPQTPAWPAATGWPSAPPGAPPAGVGGVQPPVGPPQGWPTQPPNVQPPSRPPAMQPPTEQPPAAGWPGQPGASSGGSAPGRSETRPAGLSGSTAPRPGDGATGDGERSPWAPPRDD